MKKLVIFSSIISLLLISIFSLFSCNKRKANFIVTNVGEYVEYSYITELANGKTIYGKCILYFEDTDYESTTSLTNDYYIISGDNKISPLDLKVGDKIYFELITILETAPGKAYGHYLYLCN